MNCIVIRYSELALKGNNRVDFERRLARNVKDCLVQNKNPFDSVERVRNRVIVHTETDCPELHDVFGICSYSLATKVEADLRLIQQAVLDCAKAFDDKTRFRISAKRLDKGFPIDSLELDRQLGSFIIEETRAKVSLRDFDVELGIELQSGNAYVFNNKVDCLGGLPLGSGGCAVALIEDKNSLVAAWLLMKRGVLVLPVSLGPVDISLLNKYSYGFKLNLVELKDLSEAVPYMRQKNAKALVLGTTLDKFSPTDFDVLTLLPLVGLADSEIDSLYGEIS